MVAGGGTKSEAGGVEALIFQLPSKSSPRGCPLAQNLATTANEGQHRPRPRIPAKQLLTTSTYHGGVNYVGTQEGPGTYIGTVAKLHSAVSTLYTNQ